jgi:hypothetical protein
VLHKYPLRQRAPLAQEATHHASPAMAAQAPVPQPPAVQGAAQVPPVQPVGALLAVSAKQTPVSHSQSWAQAPPSDTLAIARCAEASPRQPAAATARAKAQAGASFEEKV